MSSLLRISKTAGRMIVSRGTVMLKSNGECSVLGVESVEVFDYYEHREIELGWQSRCRLKDVAKEEYYSAPVFE